MTERVKWPLLLVLLIFALAALTACSSETTSSEGQIYSQSDVDGIIAECMQPAIYEPLRNGLVYEGPQEGNVLLWSATATEVLSGEVVLLVLFPSVENADGYAWAVTNSNETNTTNSSPILMAHSGGSVWVLTGPEYDEANLDANSLSALLIKPLLSDLEVCLSGKTDLSRVPIDGQLAE
jgi:hypothetical protein